MDPQTQLLTATRPELLAKIAEVCYNDEEPFDKNLWDSIDEETGLPNYSDDDLRTVLKLVGEEYYTIFIRRSMRNNRRSNCYLARNLYNYIRARVLTYDPLTGVELTDRQRASIIEAMKRFAQTDEELNEILEAEQFVNSTVAQRRRTLGEDEHPGLEDFQDDDSDSESDDSGDLQLQRVIFMGDFLAGQMRQLELFDPLTGAIRPPSLEEQIQHRRHYEDYFKAYLETSQPSTIFQVLTKVKARLDWLDTRHHELSSSSKSKAWMYLLLQQDMLETFIASRETDPAFMNASNSPEIQEFRNNFGMDEEMMLGGFMRHLFQEDENMGVIERQNRKRLLMDQVTLMFQRPFSQNEARFWYERWIFKVLEIEHLTDPEAANNFFADI